jgi:hypothetical protein
MRRRRLPILWLAGWILWVLSDGVGANVPINGYATLEACRADMRLWEAKLEQQRIETGLIERVACFPTGFDPRPSRG